MNMKTGVIIIFVLVYLYQIFLSVIQYRSARNPVPENVRDVYDAETYQKWRAYHAEKTRFSLLSSTASFLIDLLLLALNVYAAFAGLFPETAFYQMFAVLLLSALTSVLMIPFEWYHTMVIEQKYGFNKATPKTFILDKIKEFIIGLGLMTGIGAMLMGVHQSLGDWVILVFAAAMMLMMLLFSFLYPVFSRIFNKFKPLEDGELKEKLIALLEKNGYQVRAVRVMDASRRTTKSNAYFAGFGKMKTIVLYDTLVESMTPDEICAVFAHEMGHGLHKDTLRNQILSFVQMLLMAVLAWLTLRTKDLFIPFGFQDINYGFAMVLIMNVEFALIAPLFGLLVNYFSRRAEYRADAQAVQEGYGADLVSALKKLARQNFSDLAPSPLLVRLEYSHPTLSQRISAIEGSRQKQQKI